MKPFITHKHRQVQVDLFPLVTGRLEETRLTSNAAASATELTVADIDGFAVDQILLIGELGKEGSEIIKTHGSTAPSGTTVTLASGLEFAHSAQTKVYVIEFDAVEISHAATLTGSKSVLSTPSVQADQLTQVYTDTTQTSGYYFARYKETIGNTFGSYTDGVPYGGWADTQVGHVIERALKEVKEKFSDTITFLDCIDWINDGLRHVAGKLRRFPQFQKLNSVIGQTARGTFVYTMPTDIYDKNTRRSIKNVRLGNTGVPMTLVDPAEFEERQRNTVYTQITTEASAADTTLEINNSYDFDDSGSVFVYISGTKYEINYTGVTRSATAGVLTGVPSSGDGSISVTIPVDTYVFQNEEEGQPEYACVRNGNLEIGPLPSSSYDNLNIYMDYFTEATEVTSAGDTLDVARYDMMVNYLTWRIKMKKQNNSELNMQDHWYLLFREQMNDHIRTLMKVFKNKMVPNINRVNFRSNLNRSWDVNNDGS